MDKQNVVYREYYSATKRKGILAHATIKINREDVMLGGINQSQKTNAVRFYFNVSSVVRLMETEDRKVAARGVDGEKLELFKWV